MASPSDLLDGSGRIRWGRLGEVSAGAAIGAVLSGVASVVLAFADVPIALLGGLSSFYGDLISVVAGTPAVIIERGWLATVPYVLDAGPAGFLLAVVVSLATFYIIARVVDRVR